MNSSNPIVANAVAANRSSGVVARNNTDDDAWEMGNLLKAMKRIVDNWIGGNPIPFWVQSAEFVARDYEDKGPTVHPQLAALAKQVGAEGAKVTAALNTIVAFYPKFAALIKEFNKVNG